MRNEMQPTRSRDSLNTLKACIVYACSKPQPENAQLDHIKLNKVLWYSDTAAYLTSGAPITGSKYVRKPRGPVAKYMTAAVNQMIQDGVITSGKRFDATLGFWLDTYEVTGSLSDGDEDDANVSGASIELSSAQKAIIDDSFRTVCLESSAMGISDRTHGEVWELAADGEEIPLYAIYAERLGKVTQTHINDAFSSAA
jgi:hypothetical protein